MKTRSKHMVSETKPSEISVKTRSNHVERNLSERKYSNKVSILTELVNRFGRRKEQHLFRDLPCGFSHEIAKSAILPFMLTLLARPQNVCVFVYVYVYVFLLG